MLVGDILVLQDEFPIGHSSLTRHVMAGGQRHADPAGSVTMAAPPTSTKTSLQQRLSARARERWPQLAGVDVRFRGAFAYVTANMPDGDSMPLMRLRYGGSAARWGFAVYLASKDGYEDSVLPTGDLAGAPEDALDTACGLYLGDPTAWT
jgi:hypothetical protein